MATFVWEGRTRSGEVKKGTMDAENDRAVMARLRSQQITPSLVRKKAKDIQIDLSFLNRVKSQDVVIFTRQFATMIDAGLPLVQCLDILSTQSENIAMRKVLLDVKLTVESGATLADALRKHPKVFDDLFVNLVAAGEVGGILDTILNRLAVYIEKSMKLIRQVKGAMAYPTVVMCVAVGAVVILLWKVIPVFQDMFKDFGGALPAPTQFVIDCSEWLQANIITIFLIIVGSITGWIMARRSPAGREAIDGILIKMPIFGPLIKKVAVARFCRTLGTMISSGVPILDALEITARSAGNMVVAKAVMFARERIGEGRSMAEPLAESKVFPPMVTQMISVGEQTGAMDTMLQKIADFYDDEVDVAVGALTSMLEPIMVVVMGGVIGGMMIAMYMPIFSLAGNIKSH